MEGLSAQNFQAMVPPMPTSESLTVASLRLADTHGPMALKEFENNVTWMVQELARVKQGGPGSKLATFFKQFFMCGAGNIFGIISAYKKKEKSKPRTYISEAGSK